MIEALLIFSFIEDFVEVVVPWILAFFGLLAVILLLVFLFSSWANSANSRALDLERSRLMAYDKRDRVRLRDSALFMALLAQIEDGTLTEAYVSPHMACVNFGSLDSVAESEVLDFQKCGWAPIPQGHVNQYLRQILKAARATPYVHKARLDWQKMDAKPYLIYGGYYGKSSPGEVCPVLKVEYNSRVRRTTGLQSSRRKP